MRPQLTVKQIEQYECSICGALTSEPEAGECPECGGALINLGQERDL